MMSEHSSDEINLPGNNQAPGALLGEVLTEKREQKNLSIEDVASQLRLSIKQVKALENNKFDSLPEPMITRGFIRNYARLLGIDAEPLLQAHRTLSASEALISLSIPSANILISSRRKGSWLPYIIGCVLLLAGLGLWDYLYQHSTHVLHQSSLAPAQLEDQEKMSTESKTGKATTDKMPEPALPAAERLEESESTPGANSEHISPAETSIPAKSVPPADQKLPLDTPAPSVNSLPTNTLEVQLNFSEQSWVSIVDGDNKEIYTKLSQGGASEKVVGKPPLKLNIGNANGTKIIYKNQPVDLTKYTKDNVAHITLSLEQN